MSGWSLSRRAAQLVVAPIMSADPAAIAAARSDQVGGLLLLGPPPAAPHLSAALGSTTGGALSPPPFVMADEEGGGVQRLVPDVISLPWPRDMVSSTPPDQATEMAATLARQMKALHVSVDLAPVLDLDGGPGPSPTNPDGPRSFSPDPAVAGRYGTAFMKGLEAGGVLAVAKHFPGLGGASGNTDYGPAATRPLDVLRGADLLPFEVLIGAGARAVMVANASVPGLTPQPASLSGAVVTGLLRQELHFSGLVLTDSLSARAISAAGFSVPAAAVAAVKVGADMILFGSTLTAADRQMLAAGPLRADIEAIVGALVEAVHDGTVSEDALDGAVGRVLAAKGVDLCSR